VLGSDGSGLTERPPGWALPVTISGDLALIRQPAVLASIGAICVYPNGFTFYLTIGLDPDRVNDQTIRFHAHTLEERASTTKLQIHFPNGQTVDSLTRTPERAAEGRPILRFCGGRSVISSYSPYARCESRWWVSPLPPPGSVEFAIFLQGSAEQSGTALIDANQITNAATKAEILWPAKEPR
jgi:hypothetical protein